MAHITTWCHKQKAYGSKHCIVDRQNNYTTLSVVLKKGKTKGKLRVKCGFT